MGFFGSFKAKCFPFHLFLGYVFVLGGLIACFFMLLAYIFIWPFSKTLYRKIVINLAYSHWSQFTFLAQWWAGSNCTLHFENIDDLARLGQEHTIVVMNHKYDIDWLMAWILAERLQMLGGTKIFGKSMLKFVPLIGWAWMFTESIFLKRTWDKDKEIISRDLKYIRDYPDGYWVTLLLFCEGTRFTESKHKLSMEVAKQKGLPVLRHHLLPRTKGFVQSMHGLKGKASAILDLTVAFARDSAPPTLMSIIQGQKCRAEMYLRRIPLEDVPTESDEECAKWLFEHYKQKDNIYDNFVQNGRFTIGQRYDVPKRPNDFILWVLWAIVLSFPLYYFASYVFVTGSALLQLTFVGILLGGYAVVRYMISVTEIETSSSDYGGNKKHA